MAVFTVNGAVIGLPSAKVTSHTIFPQEHAGIAVVRVAAASVQDAWMAQFEYR